MFEVVDATVLSPRASPDVVAAFPRLVVPAIVRQFREHCAESYDTT